MAASSMPVLAHLGGTQPLTTTPVVGEPTQVRPDVFGMIGRATRD